MTDPVDNPGMQAGLPPSFEETVFLVQATLAEVIRQRDRAMNQVADLTAALLVEQNKVQAQGAIVNDMRARLAVLAVAIEPQEATHGDA